MKLSSRAEAINAQINSTTKLGDLRLLAKEIKKDHSLAMELWSTGEYLPRQLAILIMDPKQLSQELIDKLDLDIQSHEMEERLQLIDWLLANQLSKDKRPLPLLNPGKTVLHHSKTDLLVLSGSLALGGSDTTTQ
jgi:hypothetical protein